MNGNGKLTETENVNFYVSYGILTDKRNHYVFLKRSTEIWLRMNGNVTLETRYETERVRYVTVSYVRVVQGPKKWRAISRLDNSRLTTGVFHLQNRNRFGSNLENRMKPRWWSPVINTCGFFN